MVKDRDRRRDEYQAALNDALYFRTYRVDAVHICYPWISGTTFFNRVKSGRIPVIKKTVKGTGHATEFKFPSLVHVGVDDELITLGARGDTSRIEYHFWPLKQDHDDWKAQEVRFDNDLDKLVSFYEMYSFQVNLTIDIRHKGLRNADMLETRRRRSERIYYVIVHPAKLEVGTDALLRSGEVFSVARIHVLRIRQHVVERLIGISPAAREALSIFGEPGKTTALE